MLEEASSTMGLPVSSDGDDNSKEATSPAPSNPLNTLAAEATKASAEGDGYSELSREERARKALECECVAELRNGPCGSEFSEAFYCFLTSTADDQGSDCIKSLIAMQRCMTANPEAFVKNNSDGSGKSEEPMLPTPPPEAVRYPLF